MIGRLVQHRGLFDGTEFVKWMDNLLRRYVGRRSSGRLRFCDIKTPLKVIAANLDTGKPEVFSQATTPTLPISDAVRASIGIPFFFNPQSWGTSTLVDGGLMSNYPAWVFDDERQRLKVSYHTIGFRLVDEPRTERDLSLQDFARACLEAGIGAAEGLETRGIEELIEIKIPTRGISTLDFALTAEQKSTLLNSGRLAAREALAKAPVPKSREHIDLQLVAVCSVINQILDGKKHLRANVFLPSTGNRVKIFYSYNMDEDPDRELELKMGAGATGRCWLERKTKLVDLGEIGRKAAKDPDYMERVWDMTPDQQAAVRKSLNSLLSVPILDPRRTESPDDPPEIVGILNIDSDHPKEEIFQDARVVEKAEQFSKTIASLLRP